MEGEGDAVHERRRLVSRVFAVSVALSAIAAFGWATAATFPEGQSSGVIFFGAIGGMLLALLVAVSAYLVRTSPNIARLYRLLIPLLVVALALLEVRPYPLNDGASALLMALGMGFDFFLLMYFGSLLAPRFPNGMRAFCYCEAFTNLGLLLGNAAGIALIRASWVTSAFLSNCYLALMVGAVLVLVVMVEQQKTIDRLMPSEDRSAEAMARLSERFGLTAREREILGFLARGRSVPFISDALFIQKSTVETHRKHIYAKLDVHNRQELLDLVDSRGE